MKTLNVGMIGYKFMGKTHSNAWRQVDKFFPVAAQPVLHTICGRNSANVHAARAQLGWEHSTTDWKEIVESPLIDIVDISTPTDSHAEIAIAALTLAVALTATMAQAQPYHRHHMVCHMHHHHRVCSWR